MWQVIYNLTSMHGNLTGVPIFQSQTWSMRSRGSVKQLRSHSCQATGRIRTQGLVLFTHLCIGGPQPTPYCVNYLLRMPDSLVYKRSRKWQENQLWNSYERNLILTSSKVGDLGRKKTSSMEEVYNDGSAGKGLPTNVAAAPSWTSSNSHNLRLWPPLHREWRQKDAR